MSSSTKFFTWHPSWTRTPQPSLEKSPGKPKRKPLPLEFEPLPQRSSRTTDSIALQDAAVQSATSLLAVMNDCLNTHLLTTQQNSGGLQPGFGRPRSHTAPPTPMAEAPSLPLAELEGSTPQTRSAHSSTQSVDIRSISNVMSSPKALYGKKIMRPHSSPQESQYKLPVYPRKSQESFSYGSASYPPVDFGSRTSGSSPLQRFKTHATTITNSSDDTLVVTDSEATISTRKRPSLKASAGEDHHSSNRTGSQHDSQANITSAAPPLPRQSLDRTAACQDSQHTVDLESVLMEQIAAMRASHEAHVAALKETHEREIASHRSYISILEKRRQRLPPSKPTPQRTLTIDTQAAGHGEGLLSSDASATTSLQSFESSMEGQRRVSSEAAAETESLKRKLSLARRTTAEIGDVRRERDQLRDANERNDRRIIQLKEIIRKHKETEKSLKNAINGLEAGLVAANNQRLDALEGFYEACEQVNKASKREKFLAKELDDIQSLLSLIDPKWTKPPTQKHEDGQEVLLKRRRTLRQDPLLQQLDELRRTIVEKDMRIGELEATSRRDLTQVLQGEKAASKRDLDTSEIGQDSHRAELDELRQRAKNAEASRDKYNSLLHTELRRQSRSAAQKNHVMTPQLEDQASAAFVQKIRKLSISSAEKGKFELVQSSDQASMIEKELKHCMQEIILYKLDIKGYRKDLKNAHAEIEALRAVAKIPATAAKETTIAAVEDECRRERASSRTPLPQPPVSAGLGISWPAPLTPKKTISSATSEALLSSLPTPQPPSAPLASPMRPKTPLGTHKKLPKPPTSTSPHLSPPAQAVSPPGRDIQRQETLRSLSESIISSYAKRTPEQGKTPPRGRSSDPPRTSTIVADAIPVPVSRYGPEMLRTPTRTVAMAHT